MPRSSHPRWGIAIVVALGAAGLVYGLAVASAQSGPPGPGWRDVTPKSMWQRYRDGSDRHGQARRARERRKP